MWARIGRGCGLGRIEYLVAIVVVLVVTGTLATVAVAAQNNVKDVVTMQLCRQVETAESAYAAQHGAPTADLAELVSDGLLHRLPRDPRGTTITVRLLDRGGFEVVSDGRVMIERRN